MTTGFRKWVGLLLGAAVVWRSYLVQELIVALGMFAIVFFAVALPILSFVLLADLCGDAWERIRRKPVLQDGSVRRATREQN